MLPLQRLTIHAFRGLREVDLSEIGRFNVLVGLNNSGKTTVLEAAAIYARPLRPSEWIEVVRRRDVGASRAALLESLRWVFPQPEGNGAASSKPLEARLSGTGRFPVRSVEASFAEVEPILNVDVDVDPQEPRLDLGRARPGVELELRASVETTVGAVEPLPPLRVTLWERTGGRFDPASRPEPSLPVATITPFSHRVQRLEVEALSETIFEDRKPLVLDLVRIFDPLIQDFEILQRPRSEPAVYVRHARLGKAPLSTFGDGMRRVLLMGVSLASVRGGVLLIDEIESAIHAEALDAAFRWLMRACRELDVQLFTTTHSLEAVDALLAAGGDAEDLVTYRLDRKDGATRVKRFSSDNLRVLREDLGQEIRA
jgi:AAA domain, putative AbiEii toxin, Type IV TA system